MWHEGEGAYYQRMETQQQIRQQLPGEYAYDYVDKQGHGREGTAGHMQGYGGQMEQNYEILTGEWGDKGYQQQQYTMEMGNWGPQQQGLGLEGKRWPEHGGGMQGEEHEQSEHGTKYWQKKGGQGKMGGGVEKMEIVQGRLVSEETPTIEQSIKEAQRNAFIQNIIEASTKHNERMRDINREAEEQKKNEE